MISVRILLGIGLLCTTSFAPLFVTIIFACAYALYFRAYELIILGLLIDGFYGFQFGVPYYLIGSVCLFLVAEWVKPRLLMYNR